MQSDRPSLDEQMVEAFRRQREHAAVSHRVDRRGWTRDQWVADARRLFGDLDGSVMDLVNGHVSAMLARISELEARSQPTGEYLRAGSRTRQTVFRVTPDAPDGILVGVMFTPELADEVVAAVNEARYGKPGEVAGDATDDA